MAVVGIGVDVVDVARFGRVLARTPTVAARLFTAAEVELAPDRLAVRFAAKEALAKALGAPGGLAWHDVEVRTQDSGRPSLHVCGTVERTAAALGVRTWHVSLSHDGGMAVAMVVAES